MTLTSQLALNRPQEWRSSVSVPSLPHHAVHLWQFNLDVEAEQYLALSATLAPDEQQRASRFRFNRDRQRFVAGRGWLRILLAHYLAIAPKAVQFSYLSHGKPVLANPSELRFNLSHSQALALCAITCHHDIGVDVEYHRPIAVDQVAQRFFHPQEWAFLQSLPATQQQQAFFRYWTCKEAYLKAQGDGLSHLQDIDLILGTSPPSQPHPNDRWIIWELISEHNCAASVAVANPSATLHYWQWMA